MSPRGAAAWVAAFLALIVLAYELIDTGSSQKNSTHGVEPARERTAAVLRVVDGDTIVVRGPGGRGERVRYIGVDTPESVRPDAPVECFGKEASDLNRRLVSGRSVRLVADREPRDRFGRTLAYAYVGDTFVNAELIKRGYARTIEIPPNTSRAEQLAALERVAIRTNKGLWDRCDR